MDRMPCQLLSLPEAEEDTTSAPGKSPTGDKSPGESTVLIAKTWNAGVRLSVSFIDNPKPPSDLCKRILSHMNAWNEYCNAEFYQVEWDGQVRITLQGNTFASYLGTDIMHPSIAGGPTMWLGGFTMQTSESEYRRVVRHETGHILGFPHEHLRPEIINFVDPDKAIIYYKRTLDWSEQVTRHNVFTPLKADEITATAAPDLHSIMCYPIPRDILKDGAPDIPGGADITSFDQTFAKWLYPQFPPTFDEIGSNVETEDIVAAGDRLYQRHRDGSIWVYNGSPVAGWTLIGDNRDTAQIVAADAKLYQMHENGDIWIYTGNPKVWELIDSNPDTAQIVASKNHLYQRHKQGDIWVYTGRPKEWKFLDSNSHTVDLVAADDELYLLHDDGEVWIYTGNNTEWKLLGKASGAVELAASKGHLYRRHRAGQVWVYNGTPNDWKQLDNFKGTAGITADGDRLYQRREDGGIWVYTGTPLTGWRVIDTNPDTKKIVASDGMLYQMHKTGRIFKYRTTNT